jgi:hypothetical protein
METPVKTSEATPLPEIIQLLMREPDAQRLVRAFLDAAAWIAGSQSESLPEHRTEVARELRNLAKLEREIREMRGATETRWDGRSSAFLQADSVARQDRIAWFQSLNRLATLMQEVRSRS